MADSDFEIMGQKAQYPSTWTGVAGLAALICGLVVCVWLIVGGTVNVILKADPKTLSQIAAGFVTKTIQKSTVAGDPPHVDQRSGRLIQFWTPSEETQNSLKRDSDGKIDSNEKWEVATEADVERFESGLWTKFHGEGDLQTGPLNGYRRYKTIGHGQSIRKAGWWWVLNVKSDFDTSELANYYFAIWANSKGLYIEELDGAGHYQPTKQVPAPESVTSTN